MVGLGLAAINMGVAMACGALIGSERQVRQRMAGLRTNALVALGASAFVVFSGLFPDEVSPTRVAAQIVSGIGFLGAGIIFRDGFNIHGLNTAATLWCSAAVGMMSGAGSWPHAALLTGFVVFINLGLRPLVKWMKRKTRAGRPILRMFRFETTCTAADASDARALLLRNLALAGLTLTDITARTEGDSVALILTASGEMVTDDAISLLIQNLAADPRLLHLRWNPHEEG